MKVHVEFHDDARTKARITLVPGWLGRLFGARAKTGEVERTFDNAYGYRWKYVTTQRTVPDSMLGELELQDLSPLPRARLVGGIDIETITVGNDFDAARRGT